MQRITRLITNKWFLLVAGLFIGALLILAIRFATYRVHATHYHANFAVYIDGKRETFSNPLYYQDVAACSMEGPIKPEQRAHMHDSENSVVHVHDDGVTWGQFFENLNWYVGPNFIQTREGTMYRANETEKLHVVLNGHDYTGFAPITNMVIGDQDRLLLSFGSLTDADVQKQLTTVARTAKHYDETNDPLSCAGAMQKVTPSDRLHHLF